MPAENAALHKSIFHQCMFSKQRLQLQLNDVWIGLNRLKDHRYDRYIEG